MSQLPKRYIFVDYDSLRNINFSKLEKICNKVYIFISDKEETIPSSIVMQAQHLGKRIKWISAELSEGNGFMLHISFLIGALHRKLDRAVEFAILSDDTDFDSLVDFVNDAGRNCLRVKTKSEGIREIGEEEFLEDVFIEDDFLDEDEEEEDNSRLIPEPLRKFKST